MEEAAAAQTKAREFFAYRDIWTRVLMAAEKRVAGSLSVSKEVAAPFRVG